MMHEKESLTPRETRGETPEAMQLRLSAQLEMLSATGINVESLRKLTGTKALGVNPAEVLNKDENRAEA